jgi:MFS transporter, ACS family, hexuronate transporter
MMVANEAANAVSKTGRYRWAIVALLFVATTVNYIDRTMLGLLAPDLGKELAWNENDYGNIVTAFQAAYACGFLLMGWLIDKFGPKIGYSIAICIWTIGHVAHGFAGSVTSFMAARVMLGIGECRAFPLRRAGEQRMVSAKRARLCHRLGQQCDHHWRHPDRADGCAVHGHIRI